jgi:ABC-type multidrug transport system ATPase subunit
MRFYALNILALAHSSLPPHPHLPACACALQEDNFVATMTVSETMNFYADIILPKTFDKLERRARVDEVLSAMGLKHKAKTMVGGTLPGGLMLRGLSGGERKRLSIAAGILAAPSIVFLDEPTSGLDSFAALTVMGHLKRMARDNGHVVIASIHQPRSAIWSMFDRVSGRQRLCSASQDAVLMHTRSCLLIKPRAVWWAILCSRHRLSNRHITQLRWQDVC